jgi:hypothetical protein
MSLFSSHTIFNLLITLIIGAALYYYMKYKFRILEHTQKEHAKVLQSVIMSMNTGGSGGGLCMANQTGGQSMCMNMNSLQNLEEDMNRFREVNKNELIDVSDEDDDQSEDESDSDSDTDTSESSSDSQDDIEEDHDHDSSNTKKIVITNNHDSHKVEHLTGPDIKVIELTHPLYPSNENVENGDNYTEENDDDCENEDDSKSESESNSESSAENDDDDDDTHDIKDTTEQKQEHEHTLEESTNLAIDNSLDNLSVTTVFKNKNNDASVDYNALTASALRQTLKTKLVSEGHHMSETSINKLSKKDLIKLLQ